MVSVKIGSLVLCHLLSGAPVQEGEAPKIEKLLGTIVEINIGTIPKIYEDPKNRLAYRVMEDELLVRTKQGAIYQVNVNACMLVKESTDEEVDQALKKNEPKTSVSVEQESGALEVQNRPTVEELSTIVSDKVEKNLIAPSPELKPKPKKQSPPPAPVATPVAPSPTPVVEPAAPVAPPVAPTEVKVEEVKPPAPPAPETKEDKSQKKKGIFDYITE